MIIAFLKMERRETWSADPASRAGQGSSSDRAEGVDVYVLLPRPIDELEVKYGNH
ncbi:MAG: hypothetical protein IMW89_15500 [Ktedonobacteraceae bacterium]|nr:hypothetical protein [Ktedonobacteraceae bacterium]